ncbi:MAG: Rrf2 family transcriptional regulator [Acetanaerobacterium sp.]
MKISTKGRYGLRLVLELAANYQNGLIPLKEIARRQEISEKYLEQIIILLHKSGLIQSMRGSQGGYALTKAPQEITVGTVLRALEGPLVAVDCARDPSVCVRTGHCATQRLWQTLSDAVDNVVDNMTLADLAAEPDAADYVI